MNRAASVLAILCTVALLPAGSAWGETEGAIYVSTSSSTHSNCDAPAGALQWTFYYTCLNECGEVYREGQRQGSADGYCDVELFGSDKFCSPQWQYFNHANGSYGISSAWSKE